MSPDSPLLDRQDCLLVVVDAQEKLMPVIQEHQKVTDNILRLVKFAGIAGLPVVFTEQEKLGPTLAEVRQAAARAPAVTKISFDCFGCSEFVDQLQAAGRNTLLLCGIESHICVCQTALSARARGHQVHVVSDAAGSRAQPNWVIALERMRAAGVVLSSTEMLIYEVLGRAGTDEFRATLPLVK
jgi:nicotinamidase-related amidase